MCKKLSKFKISLELALLTLVMLATVSCKKDLTFKDELTGNKSILIGKWNWTYTDHSYGWCDGENWYELLTPLSEGITFELECISPGFVRYYRNDTLISEHRIKFQDFDLHSEACSIQNSKRFCIDLDGKENMNFCGCVTEDTLLCDFPGFIFEDVAGCERYLNYFVK